MQIKKATEFTHSLNPETEERDYIADEQPTTELMQYKPSMSLSVTTFYGEADFDLFYDLYKNKYTGEDAKKEYLIVYVFDSTSSGGTDYYFAYKTEATITVDEFNSVDSTITVSIHENGTPTKGFVYLKDGSPVFTEGDLPEDEEVEETSATTVAIVGVKEAYGTYTLSDAVKAAVQENFLDKLADDYGLEAAGTLQALELELEAGQKATAMLKYAYEGVHWPSEITVNLAGSYTYIAQAGCGLISDIAWSFSKLDWSGEYTGVHNTEALEHVEEEEDTHGEGEAVAVTSATTNALKAVLREISDAYLAAPFTFDGDNSLTNEAGETVATK